MAKNLFISLSIILISAACCIAQITVDHVYPRGSLGLYMVNLEYSGLKYVEKSDVQSNRYLKFYNLNHSLWKTIDCNPFPVVSDPFGSGPNYNFDALYISEAIFDCDSAVEFLYSCQYGYRWFSAIYKEDGSALLLADSCGPWVKVNIPQQYRPMYNTPTGTKLILSHQNGSALVYNVPCSLSTGIDQLKINPADPSGLNVFPNPTFYQSNIEYKLPANTSEGEIVITNLQGAEMKRYRVNNTFSSLYIEQKEIPAGTYIYSLVADGNVLDSKKIVLLSH